MQNKGKLIVFEGIDGCGKDTQIELLKYYMKKFTTEPVATVSNITNGKLGVLIRELLSDHDSTILSNNRQAACIYLAELHNTVKDIEVLLDKGINVICSRWYYSTLAYAGNTHELYNDILSMAKYDVVPDILIYLDVDITKAAKRRQIRNGTMEFFEKKNKLIAIKNRYNIMLQDGVSISNGTYIINIDANNPVNKVYEDIVSELTKVF